MRYKNSYNKRMFLVKKGVCMGRFCSQNQKVKGSCRSFARGEACETKRAGRVKLAVIYRQRGLLEEDWKVTGYDQPLQPSPCSEGQTEHSLSVLAPLCGRHFAVKSQVSSLDGEVSTPCHHYFNYPTQYCLYFSTQPPCAPQWACR